MSEPLTGWVHGKSVALDSEAPELEGRHVRVVLEPIEESMAADNTESAEERPSGGAELRWLREHRDEYAGRWVALKGDRLLAVAASAREAYAAARAVGVDAPLVELVEPEEEGAVWGGWL